MTATKLDRRQAIATMAAGIGYCSTANADLPKQSRYEICAFIKFIQELSYADLAAQMADMGFSGIEATVRKRGYILPDRAEQELPRLAEALDKEGLSIGIMASDLKEATAECEKLLRIASSVGITHYRLGYLRYDLSKPIKPQLVDHRKRLLELAALNKQIGMTGLYQNHAGATTVGSAVWDLAELFDGIDPQQLAVAFDIRHATVEGGLNWQLHFRRIQPNLGAIYVKDFSWLPDEKGPMNRPLGTGRVDPEFFAILRREYKGLFSLHVEYLPDDGLENNLDALRRDHRVLSGLLGLT